jgi:hypothetical protein
MRPYLITAKLMRPSNMKRFPTPGLTQWHTLTALSRPLVWLVLVAFTAVKRHRMKAK